MHQLAGAHAFQILLEVGNCGLLNVLECEAVHWLDSGVLESFARAASNPCHKYRLTIVDSADHGIEVVLLAVSCLAIVIHSAVPDKLATRGADLVDLEF